MPVTDESPAPTARPSDTPQDDPDIRPHRRNLPAQDQAPDRRSITS
jgi:hypothetical protein